MKFSLLTSVFLLQCIGLIRTQYITIPSLKTTWPTVSTYEPPTPTTTGEPPSTTTSTAEPPSPTTSTAEPPTPTTTAEPPTPTTSTAEPPTPTTTAEPPTPTTSTAEPPTPTTTAEPPTTTSVPTTTTPTVPTTTLEPMILCPEKLSAFYKDDLSELISFVEKDMDVLKHLNQSVYRKVKDQADALMLELNTYLIEVDEQPVHIATTLDEINGTIDNKIVKLVKTANITLDELLSVETAKVTKIFAEMAQLLTDKYKAEQFCKYSCDFSFRSLQVRDERVIIPDDGDYLCSTIDEVLMLIRVWYLTFIDEQTKYINVYINKHVNEIEEIIGAVKEKLAQTSKAILGVSMIDVLHLHHDVMDAAKAIEEFNAFEYKYRFGVINANLSVLELEFEKNILTYRKECVKCDSLALRMGDSEEMPKPGNILDELLDSRGIKWEDDFHGIIISIFSDLYKKLNYNKLVDDVVSKFTPLVKEFALQTTQERKAFDVVMQSAPKKQRDRMEDLYKETEIMFSSLVEENEKLKKMIHDLS